MGQELDSSVDDACIHDGMCRIIGVRDMADACGVAARIRGEGVDCIELCGAFGPDGARKIAEAVGNRIPVGYVTHLPEQAALHAAVFGE